MVKVRAVRQKTLKNREKAFYRKGLDGKVLKFEQSICCKKLEKQIEGLDPEIQKECSPWINGEIAPCHQGQKCAYSYKEKNFEVCNPYGTGKIDLKKIMHSPNKKSYKFKKQECFSTAIMPGQFSMIGKMESKNSKIKREMIDKATRKANQLSSKK